MKTNKYGMHCRMLFFALVLGVGLLRAEPVVISIRAVAGLQYDIARFKVKPGEVVKLVFTNDDDMSHNLVITQPGAKDEIVKAALALGEQGAELNFVPANPKVLWAVPVLSPEQTQTLTFTAPEKEGIYPYVCTYPGHGFVMFGAMYVTNGEMPPVEKDLHIPASRRNAAGAETHASHGHAADGVEKTLAGHPYQPVAPYMYRVFIEGAGPAAIAVRLPHELSYCWDAGACRLRFAWSGAFLDMTEFWKGHKDAYAKVMGPVFYRDSAAFPIRIGAIDKVPVARFKGYRLVKRYPEFAYELDGVAVFETIYAKKDGTGLVRTFRIPKADRPVWFTFHAADGLVYTTPKGEVIREKLRLSPAAAREFTVIMTKRKKAKL